jgi:hypothetical protein
MSDLRKDIESAINKSSAENGSNTPDFILAEFMVACLAAFDAGVKGRETWYGRDDGSPFNYARDMSPEANATPPY